VVPVVAVVLDEHTARSGQAGEQRLRDRCLSRPGPPSHSDTQRSHGRSIRRVVAGAKRRAAVGNQNSFNNMWEAVLPRASKRRRRIGMEP
jgi:hypothetical protein